MAVATKEKGISIPGIKMAEFGVVLNGTSPLLCNRFNGCLPGDEEYDNRDRRDSRSPDQKFQESCYLAPGTTFEDGQYVYPAVGVRLALVTSGGRYTKAKMTELRGAMQIPTDFLPIITPDPPEKFSAPVRLKGGGMERRHRALFRNWSLRVPVRIIRSVINVESVLNLFRIAGLSTGIGDWRVEKNGSFGCWEMGDVTEIQEFQV